MRCTWLRTAPRLRTAGKAGPSYYRADDKSPCHVVGRLHQGRSLGALPVKRSKFGTPRQSNPFRAGSQPRCLSDSAQFESSLSRGVTCTGRRLPRQLEYLEVPISRLTGSLSIVLLPKPDRRSQTRFRLNSEMSTSRDRVATIHSGGSVAVWASNDQVGKDHRKPMDAGK